MKHWNGDEENLNQNSEVLASPYNILENIHKLRWQNFENFWPLLSFYISYCSIVNICVTPFPLLTFVVYGCPYVVNSSTSSLRIRAEIISRILIDTATWSKEICQICSKKGDGLAFAHVLFRVCKTFLLQVSSCLLTNIVTRSTTYTQSGSRKI